MARYFFNIFDVEDVFDAVGTELADIRHVRVHMVTVATEFVEDKEIDEGTEVEMEALDEAGKIVATMTFGMTKR